MGGRGRQASCLISSIASQRVRQARLGYAPAADEPISPKSRADGFFSIHRSEATWARGWLRFFTQLTSGANAWSWWVRQSHDALGVHRNGLQPPVTCGFGARSRGGRRLLSRWLCAVRATDLRGVSWEALTSSPRPWHVCPIRAGGWPCCRSGTTSIARRLAIVAGVLAAARRGYRVGRTAALENPPNNRGRAACLPSPRFGETASEGDRIPRYDVVFLQRCRPSLPPHSPRERKFAAVPHRIGIFDAIPTDIPRRGLCRGFKSANVRR